MTNQLLRRALILPVVAMVALVSGGLHAYVDLGRRWTSSTVLYYVNPASKWVSQAAAISAVQTAAAVWNNQSNANVDLAYAGTTGGGSLVNNGKNEVFFRDVAGPGVAENYTWWGYNNSIVDSDIVFYEGGYRFFAFSGCVDAGIYIENVGAHEFGHLLGLGHTTVSGATMQPAMQSYCDTTQLTLEADDIAGIESMYPGGSPGPSNTAPSVTITSPANGSSYGDGAIITFAGTATDTQEGGMSFALQWTSNTSGSIGTGASFTRTLSAGTHTITASATDSGGMTGSRQISVTVTSSAPPPPSPVPGGITLSARGYKVKGQQKAELSWTGASGSVDVYRDNAHIATTSATSMTDAINRRGGGAYAYKVCAAGTSTCSNTATVDF